MVKNGSEVSALDAREAALNARFWDDGLGEVDTDRMWDYIEQQELDADNEDY